MLLKNKTLIERLKRELRLHTDNELAKALKKTSQQMYSLKRSKLKLIEEIVYYGIKNKLNFNNIFHPRKQAYIDTTCKVLMAEDIFSYCFNAQETLYNLPTYTLPILTQSNLGFQVIHQNMEPSIKVSSIVLVEKSNMESFVLAGIYVLQIFSSGIFITRFKKASHEWFIFENENPNFQDYYFKAHQIISVFKVNGMICKV